jgi:SET domain
MTHAFQVMVNSFTMVSPCYDSLGLVLHPLAALANHDCKPNAFVRFDGIWEGHALTICALRPIARGDQIVVTYIDPTNPLRVRQAELRERYFFACRCSKCLSESLKSDTLPDSMHSPEHQLLEQRAFELLALAQKDTSISGPIHKLRYGIHILRKASWPLHRQPLASLRQHLVVSLITAGQLHLAFLHAWIQYQHLDPKLMPVKHHPIRLVHQWLVVVLAKRLCLAENLDHDLPSQKYSILNESPILRTILQFVLHRLNYMVKGDSPECTFNLMVLRMYNRHLGQGPLPWHSVAKIHFEPIADELKCCTDDILEQELVWGNANKVS